MAKQTPPLTTKRRLTVATTSKSADPVSSVRADAPRPLSLKEKNVLEFLESYIRESGVSPTYQEICNHFGFASFNSVQRYLKQLESKGYIQLPWSNQKRAITILHPSDAVRNAITRSTGDDTPSGRLSAPDSLTPAIMPNESLSLPLLGRVAAGAPIEAIEHDEFIEVPSSLVRHADRTYALRVQGQSMIDDGILDGDVILVQRQSTAQNGEIIVAMVNGEEATVKRFYMHRGAKNIPSEAIEAVFERLGMGDDSDSDYEGAPSDDESAEHSLRGRAMPGASRSSATVDKMIELRPANSSMTPMWYDPSEVQIRGIVVGLIRRFF